MVPAHLMPWCALCRTGTSTYSEPGQAEPRVEPDTVQVVTVCLI